LKTLKLIFILFFRTGRVINDFFSLSNWLGKKPTPLSDETTHPEEGARPKSLRSGSTESFGDPDRRKSSSGISHPIFFET
jgi:hypothetical protein